MKALLCAACVAVMVGCGLGQTHQPIKGLGASTEAIQGAPYTLPAGVTLQGNLGGLGSGSKCGDDPHVGSGTDVRVCGEFQNGNAEPTEVPIPCGLTLVSENSGVQHGVFVQKATFVLAANISRKQGLDGYCGNLERDPSSDGDVFRFGPVVDDPQIKELCELLEDKTIDAEDVPAVQDALWDITDGEGLTDESRALLQSL